MHFVFILDKKLTRDFCLAYHYLGCPEFLLKEDTQLIFEPNPFVEEIQDFLVADL
jgi:hypothetical protein